MRTKSAVTAMTKRLAGVWAFAFVVTLSAATSLAQNPASAPRTLVALLAHPDDESAVGPMLARYTREGVRVYLIIASDGSEGSGQQGHLTRPDSMPQGAELGRQRTEEANCAAHALGAQPPIMLGFPDGKLGDYVADRTQIFRLTQRIADELAAIHPDAVVTWGPDGGTAHPDHRMVSNIATQLQRTGAPGVPERLYYMYLPIEAIRAASPRGEPPLMFPQAKYFTVHVPFTPDDLQAAVRAMACHRSQLTPETLQQLAPLMMRVLNGTLPLIPAFATAGGNDVFR
jgi:LmbE family N-acetylglucosaminyl deacetylase